jgi:flagellar FliJ protein
MKKFDFTLQKVLEIKEQMLKNLKNELSNLNSQMMSIQSEIENLKSKYDETDSEFFEKSSVSITSGEMYFYKIYMGTILTNIEKKEEEKAIVSKKIEAKRREIISMNIEISSLDKLKEKEFERYNKTLQKYEEIFIDEFVSNSRMIRQFV